MKRKHRRKGWWICLLFISSLSYWSCDTYNFSQPQPAGVQNLQEFPPELLGAWQEKKDKGSDAYIIQKRFLLLVSVSTQTVIKGIWPKLTQDGKIEYPTTGTCFAKIRFDSLMQPLDTIPNFLIRGAFIYEIGEDKSLSRGYPYTTFLDTITISMNDTLAIDLGQNAMLRRVNKNLYVVSLRNRILELDNSSSADWWQIRLVRVISPQMVEVSSFSLNSKRLPCIFQVGDTTSTDYYGDCNWSKKEMLEMVDIGYFGDKDTLIRIK